MVEPGIKYFPPLLAAWFTRIGFFPYPTSLQSLFMDFSNSDLCRSSVVIWFMGISWKSSFLLFRLLMSFEVASFKTWISLLKLNLELGLSLMCYEIWFSFQMPFSADAFFPPCGEALRVAFFYVFEFANNLGFYISTIFVFLIAWARELLIGLWLTAADYLFYFVLENLLDPRSFLESEMSSKSLLLKSSDYI